MFKFSRFWCNVLLLKRFFLCKIDYPEATRTQLTTLKMMHLEMMQLIKEWVFFWMEIWTTNMLTSLTSNRLIDVSTMTSSYLVNLTRSNVLILAFQNDQVSLACGLPIISNRSVLMSPPNRRRIINWEENDKKEKAIGNQSLLLLGIESNNPLIY